MGKPGLENQDFISEKNIYFLTLLDCQKSIARNGKDDYKKP